jgi:hypothetical protein
MAPHMIRRNLTNLRWNLTIRWRLSGGEWYPFRGVPDDVVQRWAVKDAVTEDQVDTALKARDELEQRANRWRVCE